METLFRIISVAFLCAGACGWLLMASEDRGVKGWLSLVVALLLVIVAGVVLVP